MKILFFAPHSAVWAHAFPEALIAEALQQHGHEIAYVGCGGTFQRYCVPMSAYGLTPQAPAAARALVCDRCRRYDSLIRAEFKFRGTVLTDLLNEEIEQEVEGIITSVSRQSMLDFERDSIPLGRVALYQFMLRKKRMNLDFGDAEWREYLNELRNALYAWRAGKALLDTYRPDRVVVYNSLYSVNRTVCKLAENRGIPTYFMHAGGNLSNRLQTLMLGRGDMVSHMQHILSEWPRFADVPCSPRLLSLVTDHHLELMRGRSFFVYSSARRRERFNARKRFGVRREQKLLVATLSSYDEEAAAEIVGARQYRSQPIFPTQIDWLKALFAFIGLRSDLFLIVRVHPREFPNRREGELSQHAQLLQAALSSPPSNAAVNWPSDNISVYDLADDADVFLNAWSSVGKEMSLLGLPVVIYSDEIPFYPIDLNYLGTSRDSYFSQIECALQDGWDVERSRKAYRWTAFEFSRATAFIGDSYPELEHPTRSLATKVVERVLRHVDFDFKQRRDCRQRSAQLGAAREVVSLIESAGKSLVEPQDPRAIEQATLTEETAALRRELSRVAEALFPNEVVRRSSRLYRQLMDFSRQGNE
jgi:hypothetical protein